MLRLRRLLAIALAVTPALVASPDVFTQAPPTTDWPHWRGAGFDGRAVTTGQPFARAFDLRVRWKRSLGAGYSGIAVAGRHAVTMFSDGTRDFLVALDADTGRDQWRVTVGAAFPGRDGSAGGPVSTPAIDGGIAYGLGPHGTLVAVSLDKGKTLWKRDLVGELGAAEPHWGFTTSPLVTGNLVVVLNGGAANNAVTAFDKTTGATVWQAGSDVASYQSPMMARVAGEDRIVVGGDEFLFALDPRTGTAAWRYAHGGRGFYGRIINPVVLGADQLLLTYRPDESILLRTDGAPSVGWSTRDLKLNYATPVTHNGLVFGYSGAFLSCVGAKSGALKWRSRTPGDGFPIVVDGHLVVLTKEGRISVAEASGDGYVEKAAAEIFTRLVWTPPSFANGRIYARDSYDEIAAVDIVPAAATTTATTAAAGIVPGSAFAKWVADVERAPDRDARVTAWLDSQKRFPVVEGDSTVHIVYRGDVKDLVLAGDMLETGHTLPMHRVAGTNLYYASFTVAPDARMAYQFTHDLDKTEADPRNPARGTSMNYAGTTSIVLMPRATPMASPAEAPLKGTVVDLELTSAAVSSNHLTWGGKRGVHVYLPPGYDTDTARRYPTAYILYGQQMLADGHLAAALEREIGRSLPPTIAVFVESTNGYEYARTFRAAHLHMLEADLVPLIDQRFRTLADPRQRAVVGADEAGFAAVETALRLPRLFANAVAHSVFPLSKGGDELLELVDRAPKQGQRFYVDWGRYDPHRAADLLDVAGFSKTLHARLAARGFLVSGREWADGSALPFWVERAIEGLRATFPPAPATSR